MGVFLFYASEEKKVKCYKKIFFFKTLQLEGENFLNHPPHLSNYLSCSYCKLQISVIIKLVGKNQYQHKLKTTPVQFIFI